MSPTNTDNNLKQQAAHDIARAFVRSYRAFGFEQDDLEQEVWHAILQSKPFDTASADPNKSERAQRLAYYRAIAKRWLSSYIQKIAAPVSGYRIPLSDRAVPFLEEDPHSTSDREVARAGDTRAYCHHAIPGTNNDPTTTVHATYTRKQILQRLNEILDADHHGDLARELLLHERPAEEIAAAHGIPAHRVYNASRRVRSAIRADTGLWILLRALNALT